MLPFKNIIWTYTGSITILFGDYMCNCDVHVKYDNVVVLRKNLLETLFFQKFSNDARKVLEFSTSCRRIKKCYGDRSQ